MKSLIAKMAQKQISVDPTLVVAEGLFVPENGDLSPAYAPFVGTLPPAMERGFRQGGFSVPKDLTRADFRASFAKCIALVARCTRPAFRSWQARTAWHGIGARTGIVCRGGLHAGRGLGQRHGPHRALVGADCARAPSPWARMPTWCWWRAIRPSTSAIYVTRAS